MECTCLELRVAMIWKEHLWHSGQNSRYIQKIHTEVHFSLSIWKVPASNVKRWSEEEKAISLKGMSWCAAKPVVDPTHHCCSCCCCTDIDFNQNFPKVPFKSSKENHSNYINSVSQCTDYKRLARVSLLDLFFLIVKAICLTLSSMKSVLDLCQSSVWFENIVKGKADPGCHLL